MHPSTAAKISKESSADGAMQLRNRENQRASRARRQDYLEDLKKRVRDYERQGATATAEVQAAARKVADENVWLRLLLSTYGVSEAEINSYVDKNSRMSASSDARKAPPNFAGLPRVLPTLVAVQDKSPLEVVPATKMPVQQPTDIQNQHRLPSQLVSTSIPKPNEPGVNIAVPEEGGLNQDTEMHSSVPHGHEHHAPESVTSQESQNRENAIPGSEPACAIGTTPDNTNDSGDVTCCDSAARIIASMRGHEDAESVWPELGCSSEQNCVVKNLKVFQMMDR